MFDDYRNDEQVQTAIRNLFMGCVPERRAELEDLWTRFSLEFRLTSDIHEGERIIMDAGCYRYVRFNHRVLRAFWIAAFVAWEGYSAIHRSLTSDQPLELGQFIVLIEGFEKVISSDSPEPEPLPEGVPEPGLYVDRSIDVQARAASELATFAVGWALLHELRHIRHQHEGTSADFHVPDPEPKRGEELSCDRFATLFLLEKDYAGSENVAPERVRQKRELGVYFALFALTLLAKKNWDDTPTHPAVQTRIWAASDAIGPAASEPARAIGHMAFAALSCLWPGAPGVFYRAQGAVGGDGLSQRSS